MSTPAEALNEDFLDLLLTFIEQDVEFVIVGAHALAAAGVPRATKDLDVFVRASVDNGSKVFDALLLFGAPVQAHGLQASDFQNPGVTYQMGLPPRRIDILTMMDGLDFDAAWQGRVEKEVDGLQLPFLGVDELVQNKRATGRPRDLLDVQLIEEAGLLSSSDR